ncbi:hypothetical protein J7T55_007859 [Diaporthe amygdali]|uniref:uncharacterized protein n=1 Tax=Phomopsis amygdali TaxID=1214568 RepID=UPI0022FE4916|nr:uncharacterized protein J7T55_007859 [Diaporthe amygdali]KAJ0114025.1 hypothetical protein J7T55_007859 [Diaporthe amygdali]
MYFTRALVSLGLFATATLACTSGEWGCGNQNGVQGPDGAVYVCNASGNWVLSAQCGGKDCCQISDDHTNAHCIC